jgi:hypothetical protein
VGDHLIIGQKFVTVEKEVTAPETSIENNKGTTSDGSDVISSYLKGQINNGNERKSGELMSDASDTLEELPGEELVMEENVE